MAAITKDKTMPFHNDVDEATYKRRIRAWSMYDWANSAFYTTILAAILPAYYSAVAGSTLPSAATATAYWSLTNSIALFFVALMSPVLGTVADVMRGKKKFLAFFIFIGVVGTGLLTLVGTGDWLLASIFFIVGRIGAGGSIVFYDSLLPHITTEEDADEVSTRGFALGYIGGGILLAINVAMLQLIPDTWFEFTGIRLSFLSVAVWWAVFSIPILRVVPEPPSAAHMLRKGQGIIRSSFQQLGQTLSKIRQYPDLYKYLIAFLIYNDGIGTIIGIAVIYGAELGFATLELVLALLLVQFVGVPFTLMFGRIPVTSQAKWRHYYLAFVIFNAILLPMVGVIGNRVLDQSITGTPPPAYDTVDRYVGEGLYDTSTFVADGWSPDVIAPDAQVGTGVIGAMTLWLSPPDEATYLVGVNEGDAAIFDVNGRVFEVSYATSPEGGTLAVLADGEPVTVTDDDGVVTPVVIHTLDDQIRYGEVATIELAEAGQYTISLVNDGDGSTAITGFEVLPPTRSSNLGIILGLIIVMQAICIVLAVVFGRLFKSLSDRIDTRGAILLSLVIYMMIAVWGYFLQSTLEFWFLAWMVGIVQGGSQALSRSLYAYLTPASESGAFFGLFSIMAKFASIVGPLLFALAVALFGNSRPAILSLIALFIIGGYLLTRVDIKEGHRVAREADAGLATETG